MEVIFSAESSKPCRNVHQCHPKQSFSGPHSGAPNDQFVVKFIIIPQLMKINVIKAFSGVFQCCWGNIICSFFPARHKKFPSQLDKIGWFPSQLIKFISQPGIPRAFKSLDPKRPNKSDKTGTKQVFFPQAQSL